VPSFIIWWPESEIRLDPFPCSSSFFFRRAPRTTNSNGTNLHIRGRGGGGPDNLRIVGFHRGVQWRASLHACVTMLQMASYFLVKTVTCYKSSEFKLVKTLSPLQKQICKMLQSYKGHKVITLMMRYKLHFLCPANSYTGTVYQKKLRYIF
jgi:hypothetical protein